MPSTNDLDFDDDDDEQQQYQRQQPQLTQQQQQQQYQGGGGGGFNNGNRSTEYQPFFTANAHRILCKNLDNLNNKIDSVDDDDKKFFKQFLNDPLLKNLIDCHDALINTQDLNYNPYSNDSISLIKSLLNDLQRLNNKNNDARQLYDLLSTNIHIRSLIEAHDSISQRDYNDEDTIINQINKSYDQHDADGGDNGSLDGVSGRGGGGNNTMLPYYASPPIDAIRMIGIRKVNDEPLGITVRINDNGDLEIARIMHGGLIDKQGLLHEGDIIKEINGEVVSTPEELQEKLKLAKGSVTLKVVPSYYDIPLASQVYMKALFTYDPNKDKLIPSKAIGLSFEEGDILQIISQEDVHWWQARHVKAPHLKGIIPSLYLEERRKAFVPHENDFSKSSWACGLIDRKKKKKYMFNAKEHTLLDQADIKLYEEVARMPPFQRKTLVLIGAEGVGRRSLKTKLLNLDPDRFGTTIPHTSRPPKEDEESGRGYYFEQRIKMEEDIGNGEYLEWGEFNGNLYGTKLSTIQQVIQSGKMCVIDCSVKALKLLSNQNFMPYVMFIKCPTSIDDLYLMKMKAKNSNKFKNQLINQSLLNFEDDEIDGIVEENDEIEKEYHAYFDSTIINDDMNKCFAKLVETLDSLRAEPQWVPVTWLY